jgi:hypothetical protein
MNPQTPQHTSAWVAFTYASFLGSATMVAAGSRNRMPAATMVAEPRKDA